MFQFLRAELHRLRTSPVVFSWGRGGWFRKSAMSGEVPSSRRLRFTTDVLCDHLSLAFFSNFLTNFLFLASATVSSYFSDTSDSFKDTVHVRCLSEVIFATNGSTNIANFLIDGINKGPISFHAVGCLYKGFTRVNSNSWFHLKFSILRRIIN